MYKAQSTCDQPVWGCVCAVCACAASSRLLVLLSSLVCDAPRGKTCWRALCLDHSN